MPGSAGWLENRPFLDTIARLETEIDTALAKLPRPSAPIPDWDPYRAEHEQGVPVLAATSIALDLAPAEGLAAGLIDLLGSRPHAGLSRHLRWRATAAYLAPIVRSFETWRGDDERWMRPQCPLCGSLPSMGQLVGTDPGRRRFLSCGCCGTRWRFRRTECPFCETDSHHLASLTVDGEAGLRIDWCETCKGYLKTYDGEGQERLLLSDWSSLHLDVIALDRGFVRAAASLYEL